MPFVAANRKLTFVDVVEALYGSTEMRRNERRGPDFDPCERTAIFLYRVGNDTTVKTTSMLFGLSEGTVSQGTLEVAKLIQDRLRSTYVRWPSPDEQREIYTSWELEKQIR